MILLLLAAVDEVLTSFTEGKVMIPLPYSYVCLYKNYAERQYCQIGVQYMGPRGDDISQNLI